jgi:hypothetical protein
MKKLFIALGIFLVLIGVGYFIWPTPYEYQYLATDKYVKAHIFVKVSRIKGTKHGGYMQPMGQTKMYPLTAEVSRKLERKYGKLSDEGVTVKIKPDGSKEVVTFDGKWGKIVERKKD